MLSDKVIRIKTKHKIYKGMPDLTPLVDVLFLLLIFFMLSSSFVQVSGIKVELPRIASVSSMGVEKFIITVDRYSKIFFNDQPVKWDLLKEKLSDVSARSNTGTIIIRSDVRTPFGIVSKLMALAEQTGLSVFVATISPAEEKEDIFEQEGYE